jgi:putative glutamine amidotransferase
VLSGGEDVDPAHYGAALHPEAGQPRRERDDFELALVDVARARGLPTLAICRGIQLLNVALGGTLVQDIPSERDTAIVHATKGDRASRVHEVRLDARSRLAAALGATEETISVNSFHHQALDRVAPGLHPSAHAPDGIIEGVERRDDWWVLGVQWHPEELVGTSEPWDRGLFAAFAAAVGGRTG